MSESSVVVAMEMVLLSLEDPKKRFLGHRGGRGRRFLLGGSRELDAGFQQLTNRALRR